MNDMEKLSKGSPYIPRKVTEREIFETIYLPRWYASMDMAEKRLFDKVGADHNTADLLSATAQLWIQFNKDIGYIKSKQKELQDKLDKR